MKCSTQAALAIGAGYILGRRRKMRMATALAAAAATGGLGGLSGAALRRGMKMLGSTDALGKFAPQLGELVDTVRGDLLDAGKAAAAAAVTNRIESLTDSLHERADLVRNPAEAAGEAGKAARGGAEEVTRRVRRSGRPAADEEDADMPRDETDEEPAVEDDSYDELDEPDEEEAAEEQEAPVRRRPRTRSPVTRASRSGATRPARSSAPRSGRSSTTRAGR